MHSSTSSFFILPLIVGAVLGAVSDTAGAEGLATQSGTGTIEMGILGATDDVRFFVDGKLVGSREGTASSHAAQAQVEVPAGEHKAVAYLRTPARGNVGEWIQLSTREPLHVTPGSVTRLEADVSRVGSGKPEDTVRYFRVTPQPTSGAEFSTAAADAAPAAASVEDTVPPATAVAVAAVPTITIRGTEVLSDGKTAPRLASSAATDGRLEVSLLVQSDPPGAETSLDGKLVGVTPLHVQLDPRFDHVLTVGHVGCESIVQVLAADAWRAGRSPQTLVQLDCK